ncbi:MAG: ABC transporter ATP-binding protein/permease [Firmicutes bacterium]|nr:ABC transporter ATP-binding protein/permease [Bacillota bacterium]
MTEEQTEIISTAAETAENVQKPPQKPKSLRKSIGRLLRFMGKYRAALILSLILSVVGVALGILAPHYIGRISDYIAEGTIPSPSYIGPMQTEKIVELAVLAGGLTLLSFLFSMTRGLIMATVTQLTVKRLRTQISGKINRLPLNYFDSSSYGDTLSRLTNDVDTVGQSLSMHLVTLVSSLVMLTGVLVMMFTVNWVLALTAVGSTVIGITLLIIIMKRSQVFFRRQQKLLGEQNGLVEEMYSGHNVVKAYNAGGAAVNAFKATNARLRKAVHNTNFFSVSMYPLMAFVGNLGYAAIVVAGAALVFHGLTSVGVIVAFMFYVRLFAQPLGEIAEAGQGLQAAAAAGERVFEFLDEGEIAAERGTAKLGKVRGEIEFKDVHFRYLPEKPVIKGFSAHVKPGQKVAIVGPTGAGKTTLVNLLMRFYEIDEGQISIDGVDIRELSRADVRNVFGMVLQDAWTFEGTIRENIVFNHQDVSNQDIIDACTAANLDHFIRTLAHGYDTVLDDKAGLSAGQKQLLTIARAFLQNAPMLILDEATSSVDTRTEALIQEAMERLTQGRTTFVIAHRLSTIKDADIILVLKDGDIIESGAHAQLLEKGGFYAELYNSQFAE